jgi:hypothetical protein
LFTYNNRVYLRAALSVVTAIVVVQTSSRPAQITWADVTPFHARLEQRGISAATFLSYVDRVRRENQRRVREGDLDHLIFYALQSTYFTKRPPIEPARSAKALTDSGGSIPADVRARIADFLKAIDASSGDARITYFQSLVQSAFANRTDREAALVDEYRRVMKFVYNKEFVAQRTGPEAVADLYRTRGLSTDTAVEAGFVVYTGLGILRALDPARRIRRVLIIGPGLDLAPRTGLLDGVPPESYQPWEVIDALIALGLSRVGDLVVVGADINPRVVDYLARARIDPPILTLVSGIAESPTVHLTEEFRVYFNQIGTGIVRGLMAPRGPVSGHLFKEISPAPDVAQSLSAEELDIVTSRLSGAPFDLIIATNILPYFDDTQLMLAVSNVAGMLVPDGVFIHNEPRPVLGEFTDAVGLRFEQLRRVTIASVTGGAPLTDVVMLHRKKVK